MRKKLAIAGAILLALAGAMAIGNYRAKNLEEYAERNNFQWTDYYDKPICKNGSRKMKTKNKKELTEAIDEFDRTENMTEEEIEEDTIETYGSRAEELDYIMERLTELSKRDFYRFKVALRYKRKAQQVRNKISAGA